MSARIPRLPPSRIPQEFRVIVSRLSRHDSPDTWIVVSSSFWSINLSRYRESSVKHIALNLLFALLAYFLFELTSRWLFSISGKFLIISDEKFAQAMFD